jgi:hypothetical protein
MRSIAEVFSQTTSPDPILRRQAENFLCDNINNSPACSLDILNFAADWGNQQQDNDNPSNLQANIIWSRLAAAIFLKNMIVHSPWGNGSIHTLTADDVQRKQQEFRQFQQEREQQLQNQNQNNNNNNNNLANFVPMSPSQMFGNFLPPPQLQGEIRDSLIRSMVQWRSTSAASLHIDPKISNVEETILKNIQSATEAIHDIDWPLRWTNLFEQAVDDFSNNALPACFQMLEKFSSSSSSSNGGGNFFQTTATDENLISNLTNTMNRGAASLCVIKLCCKRLYDPEASDGIIGAGFAKPGQQKKHKSKGKNEGSEELLRLSNELLAPLGQKVLVPFVQIVSNTSWSQLLLHCVDATSSALSANAALSLTTALSNFQRAWTTFCYEGLKSIFHLAQTQIYGALLEATVGDQPFIFALVRGCCRLHHALFSRNCLHRETVQHREMMSNNNGGENNQKSIRNLLPENVFFHQDDKREAQVWRLWKRVWALLFHIFDHYAEVESVPKKIRKTHRQWIVSEFAPVLSCALGLCVLMENRPTWSISNFLDLQSPQQLLQTFLQACNNPGEFAVSVVVLSFVQSSAVEVASKFSSGASKEILFLVPFVGAQYRADCEAANFAVDLLEISVKYLPWVWWENILLSPENLYGKVLTASKNNFPSEIAPLFRATEDGFTQTTGVLAWVLISWIILPRLSITCDEVESWEINPVEYLNSKTDANTELYNLKSSYTRLLAQFLRAREQSSSPLANKNNKNNNNNQQGNNNDQQQQVAKNRVQFLVDWIFQLLATASSDLLNNNGNRMMYFDIANPHPSLLAADAALQVVRLCRYAIMERSHHQQQNNNVVESGLMMQGLLPLLESAKRKRMDFGPLRAKAAQVVSELCSGVNWTGEEAFQTVLKAVLDLMYDDEVSVRMQVCSSLSPLIRHRLAGTVVVPHLVKIVQQFFDVLAQNQNDIVIRTLRKLFAHYRDHMGQWAVDLSRIILQRFETVAQQLLQMENETENHAAQKFGSEFARVAGGNQKRSAQQQQEYEAYERELSDLSAIGDELMGAISTIVKCVPRPSTMKNSDPQQRQKITDTVCALQELLSPMLQHMFDSPNSLGFFEGGLKLLSVLLRRAEDRVLPVTWNVFSSLFRILCVRGATDYFSNMIAVLDNFVSADPVNFMMHRQTIAEQPPTDHPAERQTFAAQAAEILKTVCEKPHLPIQDAANAIQCIDCFVLNGARCLQSSIVARYAPDYSVVKSFTFDQICEAAQTNDPLHLRQFLELPVIMTMARQRKLPAQAGRMSLLATPSLCVLLANSIFCCIVAAAPQAICTEQVLLQRALLSFTLVSKLFETFNGVGSGEYRRASELAQQPAHFRVYDRKLFILALSHFIGNLVLNETQNNNKNQPFFDMLEQEGYTSDGENSVVGTMTQFLQTALMMAMENAYSDCRLLMSLRGQCNSGGNEHFTNVNNDFSDDDDDLFSNDSGNEEDDDEDDDTDVTTDSDFLEGVYDDDDFDGDDEDFDDDDDEEDNGGDENGDHYDNNNGGHHHPTPPNWLQKLQNTTMTIMTTNLTISTIIFWLKIQIKKLQHRLTKSTNLECWEKFWKIA